MSLSLPPSSFPLFLSNLSVSLSYLSVSVSFSLCPSLPLPAFFLLAGKRSVAQAHHQLSTTVTLLHHRLKNGGRSTWMQGLNPLNLERLIFSYIFHTDRRLPSTWSIEKNEHVSAEKTHVLTALHPETIASRINTHNESGSDFSSQTPRKKMFLNKTSHSSELLLSYKVFYICLCVVVIVANTFARLIRH